MALQNKKPFIEHLHELRRRLTICVVFIGIGAGVGYSINENLLRLIQKPLGEKLFFTSPAGGFNFVFMLCVFLGLILALPCIIYQIIAFLKPILPNTSRGKMILYPICSVILGGFGVAFAYFLSLPAALHFLTNIGGSNIQALITTDTYFSFAFAYIVGFAVLFQLPLLMIILNRITPLKPGRLMKAQRYVLVGSFVVAAILTPTPDPANQALMAGPIIILYQFSIVLIWFINMKNPQQATAAVSAAPRIQAVREPSSPPVSLLQPLKKSGSASRLTMDITVASRHRPVLWLSERPMHTSTTTPRTELRKFSDIRRPLIGSTNRGSMQRAMG